MSRALQIEERAALWVARREDPSWSDSDQAHLDEWLAESDAHKVAYWRLERGWRDADRIASLGTSQAAPRSLFEDHRWWKPLAIAASLLILFSAVLVQWPALWPRGPVAPTAMQIETPIGGHRVVTLADGSSVELNTDTLIRAAVTDQGRTVWLDRGEAFFDIAKRSGQAFVIHAGARTITVLGTKFSVSRDGPATVVAVLEGRVRVEDDSGRGADRQTTVSAGDVAIASDRSTLVTKTSGELEQRLAWRAGMLVFDRDTLANAAEEFNRYNRTRIVIADVEAANALVSGTFRARDVNGFVRLLGRAYGLEAQGEAERIVLSTRRALHDAPVRQAIAAPAPVLPVRAVPVKVAAASCGPAGAGCAVIPLAAATIQPDIAKAVSEAKTIRDERNWAVLHKLYPRRALQAGEEGLVGFIVRVGSSGDPTSCRITQTSGHPLLDLETCQLIMVHATFKRPTDLSRSQQRSYEGVVNWKLPTTPRATVPAAPKPIGQADAPEEMICRRFLQTGSNVVYERICMPKSEWQRAANVTREYGERLQRKGVGN